ncbi:glycosyltransferase [Methylovulum psychrotolerans]|uniref:glycosyltransferase n=1 Tax=Methylovulum psychrotolerans TaxID=1704499 RepID=UPI00147645C1|nr:glycosyltransferase family 2 protein [Methylovulum psychrotolerans]
MIAKNEAGVIERCIKSVLPLIDYCLVVDTGSTDGTQGVVMAYLSEIGLQGEVIDEPFQDFAYNRTFALDQLRAHTDIDYCLMIDCDEQLIFQQGFDFQAFKDSLTHGAYQIQTRHGGCYYNRPQLFSNRLPFYFKSVLHEYLECREPHKREQAEGFYNLYGLDGARSRDPGKYKKDVAVLLQALETETDPFLRSRYTYYLANSYRDSGQLALAIPRYIDRAMMGYWIDEVYLSTLTAARLKDRLGHPAPEVLQGYLKAIDILPNRAEAYLNAMRLCRNNSMHTTAYLLGKQALTLSMPPKGALFVEVAAYQYAVADELAVAANNTGNFAEAAQLCAALLASEHLPLEWCERVGANHRYALSKSPVAATC